MGGGGSVTYTDEPLYETVSFCHYIHVVFTLVVLIRYFVTCFIITKIIKFVFPCMMTRGQVYALRVPTTTQPSASLNRHLIASD